MREVADGRGRSVDARGVASDGVEGGLGGERYRDVAPSSTNNQENSIFCTSMSCHTPVIPACAGNTAIYYLPVHSGVHPRTGGEHDSNLTRPPVTFRGASPCVGALGARPLARDPVPLAYPRIGGAGALRFFPLWDFPRLLRSRAAGVRRLRRRRHRARSSGAVVCAGRQREPCPGSRRKRIPRKEGRRWRHPDTHCLDELESSLCFHFVSR